MHQTKHCEKPTPPATFDALFNAQINEKLQSFSMSCHYIMKKAERRGWKTKILNYKKHLITLLPPDLDRRILLRRATSELSTALGSTIAGDKMLTYTIANDAGVPMTPSFLFTTDREGSIAELLAFLRTHQRVIVKPIDCSGGNSVTTNVTDETSLRRAIDYAKQFSKNIMIQTYVTGDDYRLLVLNGRVIAALLRRPAFIIGDGMKTIQQLVEAENAQPSRGCSRHKPLRLIDLSRVKDYIGNDRLNTIPERGQEVQLLGVANVCRVGVTCDVTESIHPSIFRLAEKITEATHLSLCGVDMLIDGDVSKPIDAGCQPVVIEINATPALCLHHFPAAAGHARNISSAILDEIIRRRSLAINAVAALTSEITPV